MEYPDSFYDNQARSLYQKWMDGLRELRKTTTPFYKKFHLEMMEEDYKTAEDLYKNHVDVLSDISKNQLKIIIQRPATDPLFRIKNGVTL